MKRKQLLMVVMALVLAVFVAAPAYAAPSWVYANVKECGPGQGAYYVKLEAVATAYPYTPITPVTKYHKLFVGQEKEMLATALTAMSNQKQVLAYVDYAAAYSYVQNLYLIDAAPAP